MRYLDLVYLVVFLFACSSGNNGEATPELISEINFADPALKECVERYGVQRVSELTELYCPQSVGQPISDASGIEYLVELNKLTLVSNQFTTIDLSQNLALRELVLHNNPISQIDLSNNENLKKLRIFRPLFSELDLSRNTT